MHQNSLNIYKGIIIFAFGFIAFGCSNVNGPTSARSSALQAQKEAQTRYNQPQSRRSENSELRDLANQQCQMYAELSGLIMQRRQEGYTKQRIIGMLREVSNSLNDQTLAGQIDASIEVAYEYPVMSSSYEITRLVNAYEDAALVSCKEIYGLD
jgi:uncharacterized membrane-anchored protein YjiN (DUF445 family)